MMSVPVMSLGIRSGVNWMRRNDMARVCESVRIMAVLARPGHAFEQAVAAGEHGDHELFDDFALTDDELAHLGHDFLIARDQQRGGGFVVQRDGGAGRADRLGKRRREGGHGGGKKGGC